MNDTLHAKSVVFLKDKNQFDDLVGSALRNFTRDSQKYVLKGERLWRDEKPCVLENELDELW